jgi:hypothetical protein
MKACVKWNGSVSQCFDIKSGVQQGSLLGPRLYNLIMDKLLLMLENSGLGCHIAGLFMGAVAYADDLIVLSASVRHLQMILNMCVDFGKGCDLVFNCDKSKCGAVGKPMLLQPAQIFLGDQLLQWVTSFVYLGIEFILGPCLKVDCRKRIQKFMATISSVLRCKMEGYEDVFATILVKKCLPVLLYGLDCLFLDSYSVRIVTQAWNCAFRWLYGLSKFTSTRHLFEQHRTMSMKFLLECGLMLFYVNVQTVDNCVLRKLISHSLNDSKVRCLFNCYQVHKFCSVQQVKNNVKKKFVEYCELGLYD